MARSPFLWGAPDAGQLPRRVTFRQRALDANGDRLGPETDVVTRAARVQPLKGGEAVQSQRLEGHQPVVIYVRRDGLTKTIDNSFQAVDARDSTIVWDVTSVIVSEDLNWIEVLAVQLLGVVWATAVVPVAPVNIVPPALTGGAGVGNTATLSTGTWSGSPSSYVPSWHKDGVVTADTGWTRTYVAGDVGHTITGTSNAINAAAPSGVPAASNGVSPSAAPSGIPIADANALYTALLAPDAGGKTYNLAGVDFGETTLPPNKDYTASPIIIQCDPDTTFLSIFMSNVKGVTINGGNIYGSYQGIAAGLMIQNGSAHITTNGLTMNTGDPDGTQTGNGFNIRDSNHITLNGLNDAATPDVSGRGTGGSLLDSSNLTLNGLTCKNISVDGVIYAGIATAIFNACLGSDWWPTVGSHPDFLQGFGVNSNITIQNSGWEQKGGGGEFGGASQGITIEGTHTDTIINACWILGGLANTFAISGGSNAQVENCFAQGLLTYGSRIIARDGTVGCTITNCTAVAVQNYVGGGVNPGFTETGTIHVSDVAPGTHADLDAWLALHSGARARPA